MNKDFFKIDHKISLLDILEVLDISKDELVIKDNFFDQQPIQSQYLIFQVFLLLPSKLNCQDIRNNYYPYLLT